MNKILLVLLGILIFSTDLVLADNIISDPNLEKALTDIGASRLSNTNGPSFKYFAWVRDLTVEEAIAAAQKIVAITDNFTNQDRQYRIYFDASNGAIEVRIIPSKGEIELITMDRKGFVNALSIANRGKASPNPTPPLNTCAYKADPDGSTFSCYDASGSKTYESRCIVRDLDIKCSSKSY